MYKQIRIQVGFVSSLGGYVNRGLHPHGSGSSGAASPNRELWGASKGEGQYQPSLPSVAAEVLRTAYERHRRGLMSPYMYQLLTQVVHLYIRLQGNPSKKHRFIK